MILEHLGRKLPKNHPRCSPNMLFPLFYIIPRSKNGIKPPEVLQIKKTPCGKPVHGVLNILNPRGLLPLDGCAWLW